MGEANQKELSNQLGATIASIEAEIDDLNRMLKEKEKAFAIPVIGPDNTAIEEAEKKKNPGTWSNIFIFNDMFPYHSAFAIGNCPGQANTD